MTEKKKGLLSLFILERLFRLLLYVYIFSLFYIFIIIILFFYFQPVITAPVVCAITRRSSSSCLLGTNVHDRIRLFSSISKVDQTTEGDAKHVV